MGYKEKGKVLHLYKVLYGLKNHLYYNKGILNPI